MPASALAPCDPRLVQARANMSEVLALMASAADVLEFGACVETRQATADRLRELSLQVRADLVKLFPS